MGKSMHLHGITVLPGLVGPDIGLEAVVDGNRQPSILANPKPSIEL
jgi:hypothetical protein